MTTVTIENQIYQIQDVPTTQEDNAGGIIDRWNLFQDGIEVGRMVEWYCPDPKAGPRYCTIINKVRSVYSDLLFSNE